MWPSLAAAVFLFIYSPPTRAEQVPSLAQTKSKAALPTSAFARLPFVEGARLSPDGIYVAGLFGSGSVQRIVIMPLSKEAGRPLSTPIPDSDRSELDPVSWQ